ncbi:hypothetical protein [Streptomyces sp. Agncl-13]|uniref:hypothetical protein n=1 Tax=Streptomyces sp. Agncl-13 TaxID=3400628 RepID=UPI003A89941E
MFALQVAIVLLLTVSAVAWMALMDRRHAHSAAAGQSLGVALSFANAPGMMTVLKSPDATAALQRRVDAIKASYGVGLRGIPTPITDCRVGMQAGLVGKCVACC